MARKRCANSTSGGDLLPAPDRLAPVGSSSRAMWPASATALSLGPVRTRARGALFLTLVTLLAICNSQLLTMKTAEEGAVRD